jgi:hypothetical protein
VLLLAPLAGAVIDRLPRVRVMIVADLWRMALAGSTLTSRSEAAPVWSRSWG